MNIIQTEINDCLILEQNRFYDNRGFFQELGKYDGNGEPQFQVNWSVSKKDVVRGIHIAPYSKLVTCIKGEIFDVAVDTRLNSPTYLKWTGIHLKEGENKQLYIPANCGHAFMALEESYVVYMQTGVYNPLFETSLHFQDPKIGIIWPAPSIEYILSEKDNKT